MNSRLCAVAPKVRAKVEFHLPTELMRSENVSFPSSGLAFRVLGDSDFMLHLSCFWLGILFVQGAQERIGLRFRQFQAREKPRDFAGVVERHADPIVQKRQSENDFDSKFASTVAKTRRQRQFFRVGQVMDIVGNVNSMPVDQSPGKLFAVKNASLSVGVIPKDIILVIDHGTFCIVASASGGLLTSLLLAFVLAETVVFGKPRLLGHLRLGLARKEFLQPVNLGFKLFDVLSLPLNRFGLLLQLVFKLVRFHAQ